MRTRGMVDVEVPDAHDRGYVALAGTPPNASETRMGPPREEDVRVGDRYPRDVQVREREDGTRYVGVKQQYADAVQSWFAEEYGVSYDDDREIVRATDNADAEDSPGDTAADDIPAGGETDDTDADGGTDTETETETETDGGTQGPETSNQPTAPEDTQEAHWNTVVTAVEAGAYDDVLDTVESNDDRQSVQKAVAERREVLSA